MEDSMLGGRTDYKGLIIRLDLVAFLGGFPRAVFIGRPNSLQVDRDLVDFPGRPRC